MNPILTTTAIVWSDLSDDEKATLHTVANWPGKALAGTLVEEKAASLATQPGGALHPAVIEAVNRLADLWHHEAGRI